MLSINVRNFRGIRLAELNAERIALVCGLNEQGKSSIIDGLRALLNGTTAPYGLTKAELESQLLYRGSDQAEVSMTDGNRQAVMRWPAGTVDTSGAPFRSTGFATGTIRFTAMTERERAQTLAQYLKTEPTKEEFVDALQPLEIDPNQTETIWRDITTLGWDAAWQKHRTDATKLKGAWEQLTGGTYGTKIGATWRPRGWGPDHEALTDAEAQENLKDATDKLEAAIGKVAITGEEKTRLESLVKHIPKLQDLLKMREADGTRAKSTREKALEAYQQVPVVEPEDWPSCPHCKKQVAVRAGKNGATVLEVPKKALDAKERQKLVDEANDKQTVYEKANEALETARNSYRVAELDLQKATDAKAQLEKADPANAAVDLDELRNDVKAAQSVIAGKQKVRDAIKAHAAVLAKLSLVTIMSPEGLRSVKLKDKIDGFNALLAQLCATADWSEVRVTPDGEVSLSGVRYALCSGSGRYRCDVTLQVAFAQLDGSEILLADEADILDAKGRNGLFALLSGTDKYCVVAMMLTKIGTTPDLAKAGLGCSYWIHEAMSQELEVAQQAA